MANSQREPAHPSPSAENGWDGVCRVGQRKPAYVIQPLLHWSDRCTVCKQQLADTEWPHVKHLQTDEHKWNLMDKLKEPMQTLEGDYYMRGMFLMFHVPSRTTEPDALVIAPAHPLGPEWCVVCNEEFEGSKQAHLDNRSHMRALLKRFDMPAREPSGVYTVSDFAIYFVPRAKALFGTPGRPLSYLERLLPGDAPQRLLKSEMRVYVGHVEGYFCLVCHHQIPRLGNMPTLISHVSTDHHIDRLQHEAHHPGIDASKGKHRIIDGQIFYYPFPAQEPTPPVIPQTSFPPPRPAQSAQAGTNQPTRSIPAASRPGGVPAPGLAPMLANAASFYGPSIGMLTGGALLDDLAAFCSRFKIEMQVEYESDTASNRTRCMFVFDGIKLPRGPWHTSAAMAHVHATRTTRDWLTTAGGGEQIAKEQAERRALWQRMLQRS